MNPEWIAIGVGVLSGLLSSLAGWYALKGRVGMCEKRVEDLENDFQKYGTVEAKIGHIDTTLAVMDTRLGHIEKAVNREVVDVRRPRRQ